MLPLFRKLNYAGLWTGYSRVWGAQVYHPSLDRWTYLLLHRLNLLGKTSRCVIETLVRPGMTVMDVGGNIGLYTALLGQCVGAGGKVFTFEPVPELYASLRRTIEHSRLANIVPFECAAGSSESSGGLILDPLNSGNNWITKDVSLGTVTVSVRRLDGIEVTTFPSFVKIDVQGWEVEVLQGMSGLLRVDHPPIIFCEVSDSALRTAGRSALELAQLLVEYQYVLHLPVIAKGRLELRPMEMSTVVEMAKHQHYFDIVAMPKQSA